MHESSIRQCRSPSIPSSVSLVNRLRCTSPALETSRIIEVELGEFCQAAQLRELGRRCWASHGFRVSPDDRDAQHAQLLRQLASQRDEGDMAEVIDPDRIREPPRYLGFSSRKETPVVKLPGVGNSTAIPSESPRRRPLDSCMRTTQPTQPPVSSTIAISPRTLNRRERRHGRRTGSLGMLAAAIDWGAFGRD